MTTTITIPTPPPWLDIDSIAPVELRRDVFEMIATIKASDALTIDEMKRAVVLYEAIHAAEDAARALVTETDDFRHDDDVAGVLSTYCGSLDLNAAMSDFVRPRPELHDTAFDPERFLGTEVKPYPAS